MGVPRHPPTPPETDEPEFSALSLGVGNAFTLPGGSQAQRVKTLPNQPRPSRAKPEPLVMEGRNGRPESHLITGGRHLPG